MIYDFDTVVNRWNTNSEKYDGLRKFSPGAPSQSIPLWIADMDFRTAPEIIKAMHQRVEEGVFGYSDIYDSSYYKSVCQWMDRHHGWQIQPEQIVLDSGVVPALSHALSLAARPGDGVIIHTPAYKPFLTSIEKSGMIPVFSSLTQKDGRYGIDFKDLEEKAGEARNRVLILCSPHNPTGRVWTEQELVRIMQICQENHIFIICDEIHSDILRPGIQHTPMARLFPRHENLVTCTAPSKTFNLAGNHLANIIIPDSDLRERWNAWYHYLPNPISVAAANAAYESGSLWLEELNQYLSKTFEGMDMFFKENLPGAGFYIPEATYLAWIYMGNIVPDHKEMVNRFIENGLVIEGGDQFVANGSGFIRMNVAMPHSIIKKVLEKIKYSFN